MGVMPLLISINPLDSLLDMVSKWFQKKIVEVSLDLYEKLFIKLKEIVTTGLSEPILQSVPETAYAPSGSTDTLGPIYSVIKSMSDQCVLPIAVVLFSFLMTYELVTTFLNENKVIENSPELIIKWTGKYIISMILITYSFEIINVIFDFTTSAAVAMVNMLSSNGAASVFDETKFDAMKTAAIDLYTEGDNATLGNAISFWFASFIASICAYLLYPITQFIIVCRFVYIYMYMLMAPMAVTLVPLKQEWGQIGTNYIKMMAAFGVQLMLIVAVYAIFFGYMSTAFTTMYSDWDKLSTQLILASLILIVALFKTESIAKSIVQAH